jgi:hypothetical protein
LAIQHAADLHQDKPRDAQAPAVVAEKIFLNRRSMTASKELITVRVNVDITVSSLQAIVENAKKSVGRDEKGSYRVDTAAWAGKVISDFLNQHDFETYTKNL